MDISDFGPPKYNYWDRVALILINIKRKVAEELDYRAGHPIGISYAATPQQHPANGTIRLVSEPINVGNTYRVGVFPFRNGHRRAKCAIRLQNNAPCQEH